MTKKEAFIEIVEYLFDDQDVRLANIYAEEWPLANEFFNELKEGKVKNSSVITENGKKVLSWMQENMENMSNVFTSKEAAEALFTSGRSIAGSMRKLVADGYVDKIGKNPVQYALTDKGKNYLFED